MSTVRVRTRERPRSRVLAGIASLTVFALLVVSLPMIAGAVPDDYRGHSEVYIERGFGRATPFLPYTEPAYRGDQEGYAEEGFGLLKPYLPYTEPVYRGGAGNGYSEEGFGLLK